MFFKRLSNGFNGYYVNAKFIIVFGLVATILFLLFISQNSTIETYFPSNSYIEKFALTVQFVRESFEDWCVRFRFGMCVEDSLCSDLKIIAGGVIELATPYWESFNVGIGQEDSLPSKVFSNLGDVFTTISEKGNNDCVETDFSKISDPFSFLGNLVLIVRDFVKGLFSG